MTELPIAVFGGAFDPPHIGHALIVTSLLNSGLVKQVLVVPSGTREDKRYFAADYHRRGMTELLIRSSLFPQDKVFLSTIELDESSVVGTYELMSRLAELKPDNLYAFVIGGDLVKDLHSWRHAERLREEVRFLVLQRAGVQPNYPKGFYLQRVIQDVFSSHSSSFVREVVATGGALGGLLTSEVARYIKQNGLYRKG
jgi:nicotinate-nucleotide adenylyltransferase